LFLRAEHVYTHFYLAGGRQLLQRGSLAATLARLPAETFLRVHRGYAINLRAVSGWSREAVHLGQHRIPISRSRRAEVLRRLEGN
ncbi:MAG: LytTR family transcriptional regulator DNA-binding domain-containing protein, partial [Bacteroidota bacterium]